MVQFWLLHFRRLFCCSMWTLSTPFSRKQALVIWNWFMKFSLKATSVLRTKFWDFRRLHDRTRNTWLNFENIEHSFVLRKLIHESRNVRNESLRMMSDAKQNRWNFRLDEAQKYQISSYLSSKQQFQSSPRLRTPTIELSTSTQTLNAAAMKKLSAKAFINMKFPESEFTMPCHQNNLGCIENSILSSENVLCLSFTFNNIRWYYCWKFLCILLKNRNIFIAI